MPGIINIFLFFCKLEQLTAAYCWIPGSGWMLRKQTVSVGVSWPAWLEQLTPDQPWKHRHSPDGSQTPSKNQDKRIIKIYCHQTGSSYLCIWFTDRKRVTWKNIEIKQRQLSHKSFKKGMFEQRTFQAGGCKQESSKQGSIQARNWRKERSFRGIHARDDSKWGLFKQRVLWAGSLPGRKLSSPCSHKNYHQSLPSSHSAS